MKKLLVVASIILQTLLAGCATVDGGGGNVWPTSHDSNEYYWHAPQRMASAEEAIAAIRNMQEYFVEWSGWTISSLDIDKYGLRASGTWPEGSQRPASFSIPFDAIEMLRLARFPTISNQYKWGVIVKYKGEVPTLLLRVRSRAEATRLIAAIETLAAERGYKFSSDLGLFGVPLTVEQGAELGLPPGVGLLLTLVYKDGPGEKAGLRTGDVITAIGKQSIRDRQSFSKAYAGRQNWTMFRRDQEGGDYQPVVLRIDFPRVRDSSETVQKVEDYWFMPARMTSVDQAVGTIKNLQQDIVGLGGWHIDDFEVDRFGMRAKGKDAMFIIPFDEISRMVVERYVGQKDFQWGLTVSFSTERQPVPMRISSEKLARRLGDAIGTLAMEQGIRVLGGAGMRLRDATAEDRESVDMEGEYGVTVFSVFAGGPAEKAGLRSNDLIVEVDGAQVNKMTDVIQAVLKAEAEAKPLTLKLIRLEGDMIYEHLVKLQFGAQNNEPAGKGADNP